MRMITISFKLLVGNLYPSSPCLLLYKTAQNNYSRFKSDHTIQGIFAYISLLLVPAAV